MPACTWLHYAHLICTCMLRVYKQHLSADTLLMKPYMKQHPDHPIATIKPRQLQLLGAAAMLTFGTNLLAFWVFDPELLPW